MYETTESPLGWLAELADTAASVVLEGLGWLVGSAFLAYWVTAVFSNPFLGPIDEPPAPVPELRTSSNRSTSQAHQGSRGLRATRPVLTGAAIRSKLTGGSRISPDGREALYADLIELEPDNTVTVSRLAKLMQLWDQTMSGGDATADTARAGHLTGPDPADAPVEEAIRARLGDLESYQHVRTARGSLPEGVLVLTIYRGASARVGFVKALAIAKVDKYGNLQSINFEHG